MSGKSPVVSVCQVWVTVEVLVEKRVRRWIRVTVSVWNEDIIKGFVVLQEVESLKHGL